MRLVRLFAVLVLLMLTGIAAAQQTSEPTAEATTEAGDYFIVKSDGIQYTSLSTLSCDHLISGDVTDLYGMPYLDFVVHEQPTNRPDFQPTPGLDSIASGTDALAQLENASGWLITPTQQVSTYEVWLTAEDTNEELSPHVLVPMQGCQNLPILHFVQVKALPGQTPSNVPLVVTSTPLGEDGRFALENHQISYSYAPTLDSPCDYDMAGKVLDRNSKPFTGFVVNIQPLPVEGLAPDPPGYAFPGSNSYTEDGPSGWAIFLPSWAVDYEVWLTTKVGGEELSAHYIVEPQDCVHNFARFNFVEVGAQQVPEDRAAPPN